MTKPREALSKAKGETTTVNDIILKYVAILAVIPFIGSLIGYSLVGFGFFTVGIGFAFVIAILTYIGQVIGVFILGFVIDFLANQFASKPNRVLAMRLASYAYTPAFLAGILYIVPFLGLLVLVALLYGAYILYLGLPVLMEAPQDKAVVYTIVVIVVALIISYVISAIVGAIAFSAIFLPYI